jgi:ATP-dependent Clp protease ATP-binding subunit ClpX
MFDLPESEETEFKVTKSYAEKALERTSLRKLKAVS